MREILLTSSVLILAVLLLRLAFRDRISRRVQYALWGLVLLRLLVPVSLPGADFSVLSAAEPVGQAVAERLEAQLSPAPTGEAAPPVTVLPDVTENAPAESPEAALPAAGAGAGTIAPDAGGGTAAGPARTLTAAEVLTAVWLTGAAAMAVWFLVSNLRFWRKLRRTRTPYAVDGCAYPVYLVEAGLPSPCLFGLVRPAVYLTSAAVETPERLRHVIAHETAHAHHLDPLWSLLRCVCLAVYWFDPLVWIAAYVSKADGELACDEAAIRALGEAERIPYGRTLLALIPVRRGPGSPLLSATTMTAGKRQLTERITRIARGSQTRAAALFLVLALAALACAVTFTGAKGDGATGGGEPRPLTGDELAYFNETFFNQHGAYTIRNQFLNSLYERPEDIDLFELFYCGTGIDEIMTDEELRQVGSFDTEGGLICPVDKMSVEAINQVLLENTGLTLDETEQIGMESFQYLPEYNAYYHSHGDTNYWGDVFISAGEREGGTIRLYYWDNFARYDCDWLCLTLEVQADGRCWFVSNQPSEKPSIPTAYPEPEPVLAISLAEAEPLSMEPVALTERRDDCQRLYHILDANGRTYCFYQSTDGNIYGAEILENTEDSWRASCFLTVEYDAWEVWTCRRSPIPWGWTVFMPPTTWPWARRIMTTIPGTRRGTSCTSSTPTARRPPWTWTATGRTSCSGHPSPPRTRMTKGQPIWCSAGTGPFTRQTRSACWPKTGRRWTSGITASSTRAAGASPSPALPGSRARRRAAGISTTSPAISTSTGKTCWCTKIW